MYKPKFNLLISDLETAIILLDQKWPNIAVTLLGPVRNEDGRIKKDLQSTGSNHLRVVVDDITFRMPGWIEPRRNHVQQVFRHTLKINDGDNVLIHCRAGISRSTAMAIGVLIQHGATPQQAFEYVADIRPIMDPNFMLLEHIDDELALDGQLIDEYKIWEKHDRLEIANYNNQYHNYSKW